MFTKEFWDTRAVRYGHTGYAESFLYCFDQEARKFAIEELIRHVDFVKKERALDFGCGSGDFLPILQNYFKNVRGYDLSHEVLKRAAKNLASFSVDLGSNIGELKHTAPYDLILSVTVLQGLGKTELENTARQFVALLDEKGFIICMEFFSSQLHNLQNVSVTRTSVEDWIQILKNNNLTVVSQHSFYNPVLVPTVSWNRYRKNYFLRSLKLLKFLKPVRTYFSKKAKEIISEERDVLGVENSTFKIYIIQKELHADQAP